MENINVYELSCKLYLLVDVNQKDALNIISSAIDQCMTRDDVMRDFHNARNFKFYTFDSLFPLESDGIYKQGNLYTIRIRTIDKNLKDYLEKEFTHYYSKILKILVINTHILKRNSIEKIYSITPAIVKFEDGYWRTNHSFSEFENRLISNLIKKYKTWTKTEDDNLENLELYTHIRFTNNKPIKISYKDIHLIGDKLELEISENVLSQEIAYFALGVGICELNSRGMGFVNYAKWR